MKTEFFLACRYMRIRRNAVSIISLTSIIGVGLGVMVLMVVLAVMTGFTDVMKSKLIETQAHFQVHSAFGPIRDGARAVEAIEKCGATAAPVIQQPVIVQYAGRRLDTRAVVMSARTADMDSHIGFSSHMVKGKLDLDHGKTVISQDMANRWGVDVGDKVLVHTAARLTSLVRIRPDGGVELNPDSSAYLPSEFTVSGIYSMGKYDFDRLMFFVGMDDAADLFDLPWGSATSIFCWGADAFELDGVVSAVRKALPDCLVSTWQETNSQLLSVLAVEKRMMFFLLIFIVLVAAFSIANTLITSVYQKTRDIGVLKALGASDGLVMRIFLMQGFLTGALGSICGTLAGYLVILFRNDILNIASAITGQDLFPKEFYYFNELPAHIVAGDVTFIIVSSILLCTLGALIPACRAARLDPAKALRYE
ncbi:MAG: ABC transporter permease [Victivallaceae bacterium]|nr:ABC transporter permease [Victivallaceae bacterium]